MEREKYLITKPAYTPYQMLEKSHQSKKAEKDSEQSVYFSKLIYGQQLWTTVRMEFTDAKKTIVLEV